MHATGGSSMLSVSRRCSAGFYRAPSCRGRAARDRARDPGGSALVASGGNLQPWKVIRWPAPSATRWSSSHAARTPRMPGEEGDDPVYPANLWEPVSHATLQGRRGPCTRCSGSRAPTGRVACASSRATSSSWRACGAVPGDRPTHGRAWTVAHLGMFMQSIALGGRGGARAPAWKPGRRCAARCTRTSNCPTKR